MLRSLRIRNFALLEDIDLELDAGLSLLTGETGAGKTILVEALGLALGDRAQADRVRAGAPRAEVEATFGVETRGDVTSLLEELGADGDEEALVVRRVVSADGRSRAFLNASGVPVGALRRVGEALVELHGQHEHQGLLRGETQRELLDRFGGHRARVEAFAEAATRLVEAEERLAALEAALARREERLDLLRFRLVEIDRVGPQPGEHERLREERTVLRHAGRIREMASEGFALLYDDERSALARLDRTGAHLDELARLGEGITFDRGQLDGARAVLEDLALGLRDLAGRAVADPGRLDEVEGRLAALEGLMRKHGGSLETVLSTAEALRGELSDLEASDEALEARRAERETASAAWTAEARALAAARERAGKKLIRAVSAELKRLGMAGARMEVEVGDPDGPRGPASADRVAFLLAANPGESSGGLDEVASGGELSRVMLALNTVLEEGLPPRTLIFDELDAGIGGRVADEVGERLSLLAERHQVLCVTHLPQIARRPGRHFRVGKQTRSGRTRTTVERLDGEGRVEEIARMLGGRNITTTTRRHATELLRAAGAKGERR